MDPPAWAPGKEILSLLVTEVKHSPHIYLYNSSALMSSKSSKLVYG